MQYTVDCLTASLGQESEHGLPGSLLSDFSHIAVKVLTETSVISGEGSASKLTARVINRTQFPCPVELSHMAVCLIRVCRWRRQQMLSVDKIKVTDRSSDLEMTPHHLAIFFWLAANH